MQTNTLQDRARKRSRSEQIGDLLADYISSAKIDSWAAFVGELQVPSDLYPALLTMRPELLKAVTPRALTADEHRTLLNLIAGLIETNVALRMHAQEVSTLANGWLDQFRGLDTVGRRIVAFAAFDRADQPADEEDES